MMRIMRMRAFMNVILLFIFLFILYFVCFIEVCTLSVYLLLFLFFFLIFFFFLLLKYKMFESLASLWRVSSSSPCLFFFSLFLFYLLDEVPLDILPEYKCLGIFSRM